MSVYPSGPARDNAGSPETVKIVKLGSGGDGVAADGLFVPYTVPGDTVRVAREGARGRMVELVSAGEARAAPACPHFGRCGGCALQHVAMDAYLDWKRDLVVTALKQRGFEDVAVESMRAVPPRTRRRASLKARRSRSGVALGFYEPGSRNLVDLTQCPVLLPSLEALLPRLRPHLATLLRTDDTAELLATAADNGVDLALSLKRGRSADLLMGLAELAQALSLTRLSWNGEPVAVAAPPEIVVGKARVALPPGAFLQATREGERILQTLVREEIGGEGRMADLFSGCGTFSFILAETGAVHAIDSDAAQTAALQAAAKTARAPVTAETRDLFRRPLLPAELARFDAVVVDPPRPGAQSQAQSLAQSQVPRVLYISCNPASFSRDARILADGGYKLTRVVPLDQFLWSPHVELFATFTR